jgi:Leucine-rich repeat (LRR) protein
LTLSQWGELTSLSLESSLTAFENSSKVAALEMIATMVGLQELNLSANKISTLPEQFQALTALQKLNLAKNPIPTAEREKIQAILPTCHIKWS